MRSVHCRMFFLTALGFFLCIHSLNHASADGLIPAGSTTPQVCAAIEKEYAKSIDLWREGRLREAVMKLRACEDVLKKLAPGASAVTAASRVKLLLYRDPASSIGYRIFTSYLLP